MFLCEGCVAGLWALNRPGETSLFVAGTLGSLISYDVESLSMGNPSLFSKRVELSSEA